MNLPTAFLSLALASLAAMAAETNNAATAPSRDCVFRRKPDTNPI